ncbi:fimbria/pilus outer membrane usher protein [Yersinia enterocolitica]|uniref:fimbria/pilus outer membrane usher protein n=1 Tax=Yersinia enterocolitica TaxID=630 RepID=UPI000E076921|nr:fimbria/pilus outer membrane usher protein [Yersinia enterocolitica]SUP65609.1 P pilus assembly protein, porin PapC [Yersinia enterocolitica]
MKYPAITFSTELPVRSGRLTPVAAALIAAFLSPIVFAVESAEINTPPQTNHPQSAEFDNIFLNTEHGGSGIDLSRFSKGGSVLPGSYRADIYLNNTLIGNENVEFKARDDKSVHACLYSSVIASLNLKTEALPPESLTPLKKENGCVDLASFIPDAQVTFDNGEQRLDIAIPQALLLRTARGTVNPALWDSGVTSGMLGYSLNGYSSSSNGQTFNSAFAGINTGLNLGAWYFRHNGSYNWQENGDSKYTSINSYVQRDIPAAQGRVLLGESNTTGQLFDTVPFTGAQFSTDDRMLPESLRGYAPEVRGIARTNALVTVRQSGQVLYETTVSPGEFIIDDLYPTGYGGNLDVTVREADGSTQNFQVPFAAVAQLLRPGSQRYSLTVGKVRNDSLSFTPDLYQGTYQRGLNNSITGYTGAQASEDYYAVQVGAAVSTPIGAVAFDVTQANTHLRETTESGQSYQVSYSKVITETNSNLSVAAHRFSTQGYLDFSTAMQTIDAERQGYDANSIYRAKNRLTVTANQGLPEGWGQVYISSSLQDYWNKDGSDQQYQMGYSNNYKSMTYGVSVNRSRTGFGEMQNTYLLSMSFPLGQNDKTNVPQMRLEMNRNGQGNWGEQAAVSGSAGEQSQFSYGATAMNSNGGSGASGSVNGQYRGSKATSMASYGGGRDYQSGSVGISGSMIAHPGGVTLTPYSSETFAVVEAKGAEGAEVSGYSGVKINSRGYAVVPYLMAYQMNEITIDPKGTSYDVELESTSQKVAPHAGAVVMVKYKSTTGFPILVNATQSDGEPVPFGAQVLDMKNQVVGSVGQGGQIYARVSEERGRLQVSWGEGTGQQCYLSYILPPQQPNTKVTGIMQFTSTCVPQGQL